MPRLETLTHECWRVHGWARSAVAPTHRSSFAGDERRARNYYDALDLPGKVLQVRRAGSSRYETIASCGGAGVMAASGKRARPAYAAFVKLENK